jgi:hypothetical protein
MVAEYGEKIIKMAAGPHLASVYQLLADGIFAGDRMN